MIDINLNKEVDTVEHGDILIDKYGQGTIGALIKVDNSKYHLMVLKDSTLDSFETIHSNDVSLEYILKNYKLLKKRNQYKMEINEL